MQGVHTGTEVDPVVKNSGTSSLGLRVEHEALELHHKVCLKTSMKLEHVF